MNDIKNFKNFYNDEDLNDEQEIEWNSSSKGQNINIICEENAKIRIGKNKKGYSIQIRCCNSEECDCDDCHYYCDWQYED